MGASLTAQRLAGLLGSVAPFVDSAEPKDDIATHRGWADASRKQWARVDAKGQAAYERLLAVVRASVQAREFWGEESLDHFMSTAVFMLLDKKSPKVAADALLSLLNSTPTKQTAIVLLHGVRPQGVLDIAGLRIMRDKPETVIASTLCHPDLRAMAATNLVTPEGTTTVALSDETSDTERGLALAQQRLAIALCICVALKTHDRWREFACGWSQSVTFDGFAVSEKGLSIGGSASLRTTPLTFDKSRLDDLIRFPALVALDALAKELPLTDPSEVEQRLLRAADLLAKSFSDEITDRFLRRWMAIEALLGERQSETTERLSERLTVITAGVSARSTAKSRFRTLYDLRSDVAHGDDAALREEDVNDIGFAATTALRAIALMRHHSKISEVFAVIEKAKFGATSVEVL